MSTEIEKQIDTGLRAAMRTEMNKSDALKVLPIECVWLDREADMTDLPKVPGIWIDTQPWIPGVFDGSSIGASGKSLVSVSARVNPSDDHGRSVLSLLWGVVRDICYKGAFSFTGGVTLDGRVVTGAEVGIDDRGVKAEVKMDVNVSVT